MKVLSVNVNNFGGVSAKPLLSNYKLHNGKNDFSRWNSAVATWRNENKICIAKNVASIVNLAYDFDVVFLHEVDTNCESWELLQKMMGEKFELKPANGVDVELYKKGSKSISCLFLKKEMVFEYEKSNVLGEGNQRNIEIKIADTYVIGLHMSYDISDWVKVIERFRYLKNKDERVILIGDLNVFDIGTDRRKKFDELINEGAIDIWLKQGERNDVPTANTNKRIDYALTTQSVYEKGVVEIILSYVRREKITDHSAIAVIYNE